MKLYKEINALRKFLHDKKQDGVKNIGFVPTMGALHEGHLSLIRASRSQNDLTVCSIFINPTQFNNTEDLEKYPRTIEKDVELLLKNGCDVLFHPEVKEMYPDQEKAITEDYGKITQTLEGQFRPGHFNGVITVVKKLFDIVGPDHAYFGQKDYQQCAVVNKMIKKEGLSVTLHICPTQREADGLAMSSRNMRLTPDERKAAKEIPLTLSYIRQNISTRPVKQLISSALQQLVSASPLIKVEYIEIVDAETLEPVFEVNTTTKTVALAAVWCGNVRLIDNMILND